MWEEIQVASERFTRGMAIVEVVLPIETLIIDRAIFGVGAKLHDSGLRHIRRLRCVLRRVVVHMVLVIHPTLVTIRELLETVGLI